MKKLKNLSAKSIAINELLQLSEKRLQGMVIEPLLRSLGFEKVRDNSGPNEKGKDIVATKLSEFGRNKLFAVQIKKKKFTGTVDSKESLGNLFHQLIQARDEEVVDPINNKKRSPGLLHIYYSVSNIAFSLGKVSASFLKNYIGKI